MTSKRYIYKKIGQLLLEKGLITHKQLNMGLEEQRLKGGYLSQHLIRLDFVKDVDITMCLASQLGFPYLPLDSYSVPKEALFSIPAKFIPVYYILPIEKAGGLLTVAMADPLNEGVIEILKKLSGCEVNVFISSYREIKEAIERYYNTTLANYDLDKFKDDEILAEAIKKKIIKCSAYSGVNRRRYKRLEKNLKIEYFVYPGNIETKIKNISMSGMLFEAKKPLPNGAQLGVNIHLEKNKDILAAVDIVRSALVGVKEVVHIDKEKLKYYVGGSFNFVPKEDQDILAEFLKKHLSS